MAESIGAVRADFAATSAAFAADMVKMKASTIATTSAMERAFFSLEKNTKNATNAITNLRTASAVLAATGLFFAVKSAIDFTDQIGKTAKAVGLTAEAFQELRYAAALSGMSVEEFDKSMATFTRKIGEAQTGNKSLAETFAKLGISMADLKTKTPDQLLNKLADAYNQLPNAATKAAVAQEFFSKTGIKMGEMLASGSAGINELRQKAKDLGVVLSNDLVARAEKANDELDVMAQVLKVGLTNAALQFIPVISQLGQIVTSKEFIDGMKGFADMLSIILEICTKLGPEIAAITAGLTTLAMTKNPLLAGGVAASVEVGGRVVLPLASDIRQMREAEEAAKSLTQKLGELQQRRDYLVSQRPDLSKGIVGDKGVFNMIGAPGREKQIAALDAQIAAYQQQIKDGASPNKAVGLGSNWKPGDLSNLLGSGGGFDVQKNTAMLKANAVALQDTIDRYAQFGSNVQAVEAQLKLENEAIKNHIDLNSAAGKEWANAYRERERLTDAMASQKKILEEIRTPQEAYALELENLNNLLAMGALSQDQYNAALEHAKDRYRDAQAGLKGIEGAGREMGQTVGDALKELVKGTESWTDSLWKLGEALAEIIIQKTALDPLGDAAGDFLGDLFGGGSSGGGGIGDWISGLFGGGSSAGADTDFIDFGLDGGFDIFGGGFASGGTVFPDKSYIVGEKGPEVFKPYSSGSIIPNRELGAMQDDGMVQQGEKFEQHLHISTGVSQTVRAEIMNMMPAIADASAARTADKKRRGGSFGRIFSK